MSKEKKGLQPGDRVINLKDKVEVIATKTHGSVKKGKMKEGAVIKCHPEVAKHMIKTGWAKAKGGESKEK